MNDKTFSKIQKRSNWSAQSTGNLFDVSGKFSDIGGIFKKIGKNDKSRRLVAGAVPTLLLLWRLGRCVNALSQRHLDPTYNWQFRPIYFSHWPTDGGLTLTMLLHSSSYCLWEAESELVKEKLIVQLDDASLLCAMNLWVRSAPVLCTWFDNPPVPFVLATSRRLRSPFDSAIHSTTWCCTSTSQIQKVE